MKPSPDSIQFVKAFLKNPTNVGAIVPSAPCLARAMICDLEIARGETVMELGPGTGALTSYIRGILPDTNSYLGIEREKHFVELLETRYPDMQFLKGSAEHANDFHEASGLGPVKVIISGLPFATLVASVREEIIDNIVQLMQPGVVFRTFQYIHAFPLPPAVRFRRMMNTRFGKGHRSAPVLPNFPPAYVLTWKG